MRIRENDEKRVSPRIKSRFPVVVSCPTGETYNAKTIDISPQGLLLEIQPATDPQTKEENGNEKCLSLGTVVKVTLNSPFLAHKQASNVIPYQIVRSAATANERIRVGLKIQGAPGATGKDFKFIDPDEYVIPPKLETVFLELLEKMNLELSGSHARVIVLTGATSESGITTLSWWLANCLSYLADTKVLYVDANLRPKVSDDPDEYPSGLLELLLGQESLAVTAIPMGRSSLSLLDAGGRDGFLGYEVTENHILSTLEKFREYYQYTIIDALSVNSSPLTAMLAKHADGTFMILEAGRDERKVAKEAVEKLCQVKAKILGVILNKC